MFSAMINQQHIIVQLIYNITWSLAVSLTTVGAFACTAICLSHHDLNDDDASCEVIIRREIEKLSPKQIRLLWIVILICILCWIIVLLPGALAPFI